jgi:5-methylcytosine-specific restriction protein A
MISSLFRTFLENWSSEKSVLNQEMQQNKAWNEAFRRENDLATGDKEYKKHKKSLQISKNKTASIFLSGIPDAIVNNAALLSTEYKVNGSLGKGNISEIPWICVFDNDITSSAEEGYYLVYLMRADSSGFYLSLNQGWTQYERAFETKQLAQTKIRTNANKLKRLLKTNTDFSFNDLDLKGISKLSKGYELGNICSAFYDLKNMPSSNSLLNDLNKLLGVYRELKSLVGKDILDIDLILDEEQFQEKAQFGKVRTPKKGKLAKKKRTNSAGSSSWLRDPDMAFTAIYSANFKCEVNPRHETFISPVTSKPFMEAHHLIPMEFQNDFEYSIDVPENIISLCPNCHRAFHNSTDKIKSALVRSFFAERKIFLRKREISLIEDDLLRYYTIR